MADDPYRSLAWLVRKAGAYKNTKQAFAEFQWAGFFRKHKVLYSGGRFALKTCQKRAEELARSPAARRLPGFIGKKSAR